MKKPQPSPILFLLITNDGEVVGIHHKQKDAFTDRRAFLDAGVTNVKIWRYEPKEEIK